MIQNISVRDVMIETYIFESQKKVGNVTGFIERFEAWIQYSFNS